MIKEFAIVNLIAELVISFFIFLFGVSLIYFLVSLTNVYHIDPQTAHIDKNIIIVDKNLTVQKVILVTRADTAPTVLLGNLKGIELPFTTSIQSQYFYIRPVIFLAGGKGVVYDRQNGLITHLIEFAAGH